MGYYNSRNGLSASQRAFKAGYTKGKNHGDYKAGELAGKLSVAWSVLRCLQIVIVVAAMFIVLRGCGILMTLQ